MQSIEKDRKRERNKNKEETEKNLETERESKGRERERLISTTQEPFDECINAMRPGLQHTHTVCFGRRTPKKKIV